jgi:hypothetical protein
MVWIGVHPNTFLKRMSPSVQELMSAVKQEKQGKTMVARNTRISNFEFRISNSEPSRSAHSASKSEIRNSKFEIQSPAPQRTGASR